MPPAIPPMPPIVVDTREGLPYRFEGLRSDRKDGRQLLTVQTVTSTLAAGDYSLQGFETQVAIERKSLPDLFGTLGRGRKRFETELARLAEMRFAAVVVEGDWRNVLNRWPPELRELLGWLTEGAMTALPPYRERYVRWATALGSLIAGPPAHSKLNPKTVWRSVLAWQQRYPAVHWHLLPGRRMAEVCVYRMLERWWTERHRQ